MRKPELSALTGIRFYAALLVFLSHAPLIPGMESMAGHLLLFNAGVVGVSFFFVLSGFILTYNYVDLFRTSPQFDDYKNFLWDRFTKIYPVHFAITLLMIPPQAFGPNLPLDWRAVPVHLLLAQCFWPSPDPAFHKYLNVPSWSISCEWFFYLLAPLVIWCVFGKLRRLVLIALLAMYAGALAWSLNGSAEFTQLFYVSWFAPSRFPEFLCGVILANIYLSRSARHGAVISTFFEILGTALIVVGALAREPAPWPFWGGLLYVPGSVFLIYGLAQDSGVLATQLRHPWLNRLGVASFSFYLVHAPILRGLRLVWVRLGWQVSSWSGFLATTFLVYLAVQGLALAICYRYEIPVQKRLRKLASRPGPADSGTPQPSPPLRARAASSST